MLSDGRAGKLDRKQGAALMARACEQGDMYACTNVAYRFYQGTYGERNDSHRAQQLFAGACTIALPDHPYLWYRQTARKSCELAKNLS